MTRSLLLASLGLSVVIALVVWLGGSPPAQAPVVPSTAAMSLVSTPAAPEIFASPIHGGCYIAGPSDCRIHIEPFTIDIASGQKLVQFQLVSIQGGTGQQRVIYDWRPDQSNPVPAFGATYSPSLVAQDFAVTCGKSYEVSLQGKDTGDSSVFNLGLTGQFTCPSTMP